jgi:hypothetical protein
MYCEAQFQEKVKSSKDGSKRRCSTIFARNRKGSIIVRRTECKTLLEFHVFSK